MCVQRLASALSALSSLLCSIKYRRVIAAAPLLYCFCFGAAVRHFTRCCVFLFCWLFRGGLPALCCESYFLLCLVLSPTLNCPCLFHCCTGLAVCQRTLISSQPSPSPAPSSSPLSISLSLLFSPSPSPSHSPSLCEGPRWYGRPLTLHRPAPWRFSTCCQRLVRMGKELCVPSLMIS